MSLNGRTGNAFSSTKGSLRIGLNFSRNYNEVVSLGDGVEILELAEIWGDFGPKILVREGEAYGTIYGYDYIRHEESGEPILNEAGTHYLVTENLDKIYAQRWIDHFRQPWEAFSLLRRTNSLPREKPENNFYRFQYPISEQTYNFDNWSAKASEMGGDQTNVKLWWMK